MRITQCSTVLRFFKPHVFRKYGFVEYTKHNMPTVFWGMYPSSARRLITHKSFAVVVWRGSDAMTALKNKSFVQFFKKEAGRIKHIAISNFIEQDLGKVGIPYISLPITSMNYSMCHVMPRGNYLYAYGAKNDGALIKYQAAMTKEISIKTGIPLKIVHKDMYNRTALVNTIYSDCFLGLRLLSHDGLSNSVVEMGKCGRMVISNSNLPNAIPFTDAKSIIKIVMYEYEHRKDDNLHIAKAMDDYINVSNDWLFTEYYNDK